MVSLDRVHQIAIRLLAAAVFCSCFVSFAGCGNKQDPTVETRTTPPPPPSQNKEGEQRSEPMKIVD